jgi:hypothetical protein
MNVDNVFLWDVNDEEGFGVFRISQVLEPAMESEFIAFSKDLKFVEITEKPEETINFSIDEEKMRVVGAILIPNKKFYRKELDGFAMFSKEAVEKARLTFKKNNNMFSVNVEHSEKGAPAFLLEDWIVENTELDKSNSKWNLSFEEGTWIGVMQITDKTYWNDYIKSGKVKGFSIELDGDSVIQKKLSKMNKKEVKKLGEATLEDGTQIYFEGDVIDLGVAIFMDAELTQPAPDGEHVDSEGNVVVTRDGLVVEVRPKSDEEVVEEELKAEYALKSEMTELITNLQSRIEKLEAELSKKNEELEKEVKELKSNTPGGKSFVFGKKKQVETQNLKREMKFSERLKKTYQELGKL